MNRIMLVASAIAMLVGPPGQAAEYVPGKMREDGLYIPPHFRAASQRVHATEAWFDALVGKEPADHAGKLPPAAATSPPARTAPDGRS